MTTQKSKRILWAETAMMFTRVFAAAALFLLAIGAAEDFEARFFPIARTSTVDVVSRTDTRICWDQNIVKYRQAVPVYSSWRVWDADNPEGEIRSLSFTPYDPRTGQPRRADDTPPKGFDGRIRECADIPSSLRGVDKSLTFSARIDYRVWHGLWTVSRFVGPFTVRAHKPNGTITLPSNTTSLPQQLRLHGIPAYGEVGKPLLGFE